MYIMDLLKDWIVPIFSIILSIVSILLAIWLSSSAKKDAQRSQDVLEGVNSAIEGWQEKINASTLAMLDSMPQIIEAKAALARLETAQSITETINQVANNPQGGASGHTQEQIVNALLDQLNSSHGVKPDDSRREK